MDKIVPVIQDTPVNPKTAEPVYTWYTTETKEGFFSSVELPWLMAQGWEVVNKEYRLEFDYGGGVTRYSYYCFLQRRSIMPETVLNDLVQSYTTAYNDGRELNDQRYDDALELYIAALDETEDTFNALQAWDNNQFRPTILAIIADMKAENTLYDNTIDNALNDFGDAQRDQLETRFDNEKAAAQSALVDRGMSNTTILTSMNAGFDREYALALTDLEDTILEKQLDLEHRRHAATENLHNRLLEAEQRWKDNLRAGVEMQINTRNAVLDALSRFIERREDSYPDLAEIGDLAASLGAGSAGVYVP